MHSKWDRAVSYTHLDVYKRQGQGFAEQPQTFRLEQRFDGTLSVPEGRRLMVLDEDLNVVGDTLSEDQIQPATSGYLLLI